VTTRSTYCPGIVVGYPQKRRLKTATARLSYVPRNSFTGIWASHCEHPTGHSEAIPGQKSASRTSVGCKVRNRRRRVGNLCQHILANIRAKRMGRKYSCL